MYVLKDFYSKVMQKFNLSWNEYESHLSRLMRDLMMKTDLSDFTLICEDSSFQVHKVVLAACSEVFTEIIKQTPGSNSVIYLRGIPAKQMETLVEFMYLGQAQLLQADIEEFINTARDLKIRGIEQDYGDDDVDESFVKSLSTKDEKMELEQNSIHRDLSEDTENTSILSPPKQQGKQPKKSGSLECLECHMMFSRIGHLNRHRRAIHQGLRPHQCNFCIYSASTHSNLKMHIKAKHPEGVE